MNRSSSSGLLIGFLALVSATTGFAAGSGLELVSDYLFSEETVNTERVSELDPEVRNPHRQRWVMNRKIQLRGLEARQITAKDGRRFFTVRAGTVESHAIGYLRGIGPWYRPLEEFPCTKEPGPRSDGERFATREGARFALDAAQSGWLQLLRKEKSGLELALSRIKASSQELALKRGLLEYENWLRGLEAGYHGKVYASARDREWKFYLDRAAESSRCRAKISRPAVPAWENMMEPLPAAQPLLPLVRAPARRWNGLFSVRLNIEIGTKRLNGRFLVDSSARISTVSPEWLEGQGILQAWVEVPANRLEKFTWSGGQGLTRKAVVDQVEMSGFKLEQQTFLFFESDFYSAPEHLTSCCDGILGADFLSRYVVEFLSGPVTEVVIWAKKGFRPPAAFGEADWYEASVTPRYEFVSDCRVESSAGQVPGVTWDTGSSISAELHRPWAAWAKRKPKGGWKLFCGPQAVSAGFELEPPSNPRQQELKEGYPGTNIGIPVLSRTPFILDLPHGRIWFPRKGIDKPILENRTGLVLEFESVKGDRVLKVVALTKGTAAIELRERGLKPGMAVIRVDGKPVEDLDFWEIEQRLSGAYGDQVALEWVPSVLKKGQLPPAKPNTISLIKLSTR